MPSKEGVSNAKDAPARKKQGKQATERTNRKLHSTVREAVCVICFSRRSVGGPCKKYCEKLSVSSPVLLLNAHSNEFVYSGCTYLIN